MGYEGTYSTATDSTAGEYHGLPRAFLSLRRAGRAARWPLRGAYKRSAGVAVAQGTARSSRGVGDYSTCRAGSSELSPLPRRTATATTREPSHALHCLRGRVRVARLGGVIECGGRVVCAPYRATSSSYPVTPEF